MREKKLFDFWDLFSFQVQIFSFSFVIFLVRIQLNISFMWPVLLTLKLYWYSFQESSLGSHWLFRIMVFVSLKISYLTSLEIQSLWVVSFSQDSSQKLTLLQHRGEAGLFNKSHSNFRNYYYVLSEVQCLDEPFVFSYSGIWCAQISPKLKAFKEITQYPPKVKEMFLSKIHPQYSLLTIENW